MLFSPPDEIITGMNYTRYETNNINIAEKLDLGEITWEALTTGLFVQQLIQQWTHQSSASFTLCQRIFILTKVLKIME